MVLYGYVWVYLMHLLPIFTAILISCQSHCFHFSYPAHKHEHFFLYGFILICTDRCYHHFNGIHLFIAQFEICRTIVPLLYHSLTDKANFSIIRSANSKPTKSNIWTNFAIIFHFINCSFVRLVQNRMHLCCGTMKMPSIQVFKCNFVEIKKW